MSYNVRLFDLYNWSHNLETRAEIFDFLKQEKPAVLCFQEFYSQDGTTFNNIDSVKKVTGLRYFKKIYSETLRITDHWGMAIFSRYPILKMGRVNFSAKSSNAAMYCDLQTAYDTIRLYNVHMESVRLDIEDYSYLQKVKENRDSVKVSSTGKLVRRLKKAFIKRASQVDELVDHIAKSPYKTVVCGDLNDTPASYTYRLIKGNMKDAFVESGYGIGSTYNGIIPALRIDYIFHDNKLESSAYRKYHKNLSDHFPISCKVYVKSN